MFAKAVCIDFSMIDGVACKVRGRLLQAWSAFAELISEKSIFKMIV
jgi:hypothetical protein